MWNAAPSEGIDLPSETMTEPDQVCLTVREILTRFGALPDIKEVFSGQYDSEEDALAASAFDVLSKEEALERSAELAEQFEQARASKAQHSAEAEEGPISSPPQASEKEEPAPPVGPASQDDAEKNPSTRST